jgi:hypothetical protein
MTGFINKIVELHGKDVALLLIDTIIIMRCEKRLKQFYSERSCNYVGILNQLFSFRSTPQGYDYWDNIRDSLC